MHKSLTTLSTWAGATALAGAMLLVPGAACAQAGSMNPSQPGTSAQPGQPQTPVSPSQQQMENQQEMQGRGLNNQQTDKMQARAQDSAFVQKALAGDMAEVQLGQLALQKSQNPQVKQFAQRMIDDHTKLSDNMKPVAEQLGVNAPTKLNKKDQKTLEKLSALSGTAFDHAYMKDMVNDHKHDLRDFKEEAISSQNPAVKTAANQGAQVISAHLQQAERIASQQTASAGE